MRVRLPKVETPFPSAAPYAGADAVRAVMTGMHDDGADGFLKPKAVGVVAVAVAPYEETSVASGMPREAVALSAAKKVAPLFVSPIEILHARAQT